MLHPTGSEWLVGGRGWKSQTGHFTFEFASEARHRKARWLCEKAERTDGFMGRRWQAAVSGLSERSQQRKTEEVETAVRRGAGRGLSRIAHRHGGPQPPLAGGVRSGSTTAFSLEGVDSWDAAAWIRAGRRKTCTAAGCLATARATQETQLIDRARLWDADNKACVPHPPCWQGGLLLLWISGIQRTLLKRI